MGRFIGYAVYFATDMLPFMLIALVPTLTWRIISIIRRKKTMCINVRHEIGVIVFAVYLGGIIGMTSVSYGAHLTLPELSRIQLIPFMVFREMARPATASSAIYNAVILAGNVAVFMPVGLMAALLWKRCARAKGALLLGLVTSLFIELLQMFTNRCTDIDDIWLNTLGVFAGFGVYSLIKRFRVQNPL